MQWSFQTNSRNIQGTPRHLLATPPPPIHPLSTVYPPPVYYFHSFSSTWWPVTSSAATTTPTSDAPIHSQPSTLNRPSTLRSNNYLVSQKWPLQFPLPYAISSHQKLISPAKSYKFTTPSVSPVFCNVGILDSTLVSLSPTIIFKITVSVQHSLAWLFSSISLIWRYNNFRLPSHIWICPHLYLQFPASGLLLLRHLSKR